MKIPMSYKFKVGDKVRAKPGGYYFSNCQSAIKTMKNFPSEVYIYATKEGGTRITERTHSSVNGLNFYRAGCSNWCSEEGLELVEEATPSATPKFKVGDRVEILEKGGISYAKRGDIVTVSKVDGNGNIDGFQEWKNNNWAFENEWYRLVEEAEPLTNSFPVHDDFHSVLIQEVADNYRKYYYGVDTSDIKITPTPNKPIMKTVTTMMKKLLDADTQKLVKAGFVNGDLELTERGRAELTAILFTNYKKELVEVAKEVIKEEDK